jgi:hypothetical protein
VTDFASHLIGCVREMLRRYQPFADMTRDDLDNVVLADLEAELRRDLDEEVTAEVAAALAGAKADREFEEMTQKTERGNGRSA